MSDATETPTVHRHEMSYAYPISTNSGVELGTCGCGIKVCRQIPDGESPASARTVAIPRDWDLAEQEAAAELERLEAAAAVTAERFGAGAEQEATNRVHVIAALYAVAAFFADHPDVPVPQVVQLHARLADHAALEALANAYNTTIYGDRPQVSVGIDPPGLYATLIAYVPGTDRPLL